MIVQEDNAPSHSHHYVATVYNMRQITRLLWPGNSPDLNAIEPAWAWLKKRVTSRGAPTSRAEMEKRWIEEWNELPQEQIQKWIEGIMHNIQEVIRLEGGNEYKEGRHSKRSYKGRRVIGLLSRHAFLSPLQSDTDGQGDGEVQSDSEWSDDEG
jgi:DDE superfamily endonuclease